MVCLRGPRAQVPALCCSNARPPGGGYPSLLSSPPPLSPYGPSLNQVRDITVIVPSLNAQVRAVAHSHAAGSKHARGRAVPKASSAQGGFGSARLCKRARLGRRR